MVVIQGVKVYEVSAFTSQDIVLNETQMNHNEVG